MYRVKIFYPVQHLFFQEDTISYDSALHYIKVVISQNGRNFSYVDISNNNIINRKDFKCEN